MARLKPRPPAGVRRRRPQEGGASAPPARAPVSCAPIERGPRIRRSAFGADAGPATDVRSAAAVARPAGGHDLGSGRASVDGQQRRRTGGRAPQRRRRRDTRQDGAHRRERAGALPRRSNEHAVPGGRPRGRRVTRVQELHAAGHRWDSAAAGRWPCDRHERSRRRRPRQARWRSAASRASSSSTPRSPSKSSSFSTWSIRWRRPSTLQSPLVFDLPPGSANGTVLQESAELAKIENRTGRRRRPDRVRHRPRCSSRIACRPTPARAEVRQALPMTAPQGTVIVRKTE